MMREESHRKLGDSAGVLGSDSFGFYRIPSVTKSLARSTRPRNLTRLIDFCYSPLVDLVGGINECFRWDEDDGSSLIK